MQDLLLRLDNSKIIRSIKGGMHPGTSFLIFVTKPGFLGKRKIEGNACYKKKAGQK
jgi:hypothetical protein